MLSNQFEPQKLSQRFREFRLNMFEKLETNQQKGLCCPQLISLMDNSHAFGLVAPIMDVLKSDYHIMLYMRKNYIKTALESQLLSACIEGDVKKVEFLLKKGADANATDEFGKPAFVFACINGFENYECFGKCHYLDILNGKVITKTEKHLLLKTYKKGHSQIVMFLLQLENEILKKCSLSMSYN